MLPPDRRMRRSDEFRRAVRRGRRASGRRLVLHLLPADPTSGPDEPARVGLVVGKGVGGAVVRNAVSRRIRHVMRDRLDRLPAGTLVVVRALGPARDASSDGLAADVDRMLDRLLPAPSPTGGSA